MEKIKIGLKVTLLILVLLIHSTTVFAEQTKQVEIDDEIVFDLAQEVGEEIMSPFCPGRTLQSCPSENARQLKLEITSLLKMGYSKDAVKRKMLIDYGEEISGLPANNSFKNVAWLSPALFGLIGLIIVYLGLRFMRNESTDSNIKPSKTDEDLLKIEEQLRK